MSGKRAENRRAREQSLTEASLLLFLERGIEKVTIDEITKAASMAKGNFYRYFANKGELVDAIFGPIASAVRRAMREATVAIGRAENTSSLTAAYGALGFSLAGIGVEHPSIVRLYLQENRSPATDATRSVKALSSELSAGAIHLTEVAKSHGLLRVSDPRVSTLAVIGAIENLALHLVTSRLDLPPADIARMLIDLVMNGLRPSSSS